MKKEYASYMKNVLSILTMTRARLLNFIAVGLLLILAGGLVSYYRDLNLKIVSRESMNAADISYEFPVQFDHWKPYQADKQLAANGNPRMVIGEHLIDLGPISSGEHGRVIFFIRNEGDAKLVIEGANTTCGCLSANLSSVVIPPGKASQVQVDYTFDDLNKQSQIIVRGLVFLTNDPQYPQGEVWLKATTK